MAKNDHTFQGFGKETPLAIIDQTLFDEIPKQPFPQVPPPLGTKQSQWFQYEYGHKGALEVVYDERFDNLKKAIEGICKDVKVLKELASQRLSQSKSIVSQKIFSLPSDRYNLKSAVEIIIEIYPDEVLALLPEFKLYGEGATEIEAIENLKMELIDFIEDIDNTPDVELEGDLKNWKTALELIVTRCR